MASWLFRGLSQYLKEAPLAPVSSPQAAVLVLISRGDNPSILFTKRAAHLRNHPGEVCFPGGMWEPGDTSLLMTAQRETLEEIGLPAGQIQLLGCLPQCHTRAGTLVTPFVAAFDASFPLQPSPHELDSIFMVPIAEFKNLQVRVDYFERPGLCQQVPVYQYQSYEIWGFTAAVTAELLLLVERTQA